MNIKTLLSLPMAKGENLKGDCLDSEIWLDFKSNQWQGSILVAYKNEQLVLAEDLACLTQNPYYGAYDDEPYHNIHWIEADEAIDPTHVIKLTDKGVILHQLV